MSHPSSNSECIGLRHAGEERQGGGGGGAGSEVGGASGGWGGTPSLGLLLPVPGTTGHVKASSRDSRLNQKYSFYYRQQEVFLNLFLLSNNLLGGPLVP
jgi:hypothetical protein